MHSHVRAGNACYRSLEDVNVAVDPAPPARSEGNFLSYEMYSITCMEEFNNDTYKGNMGQFTV